MSWHCAYVVLIVNLFHSSVNCSIWKASWAWSGTQAFAIQTILIQGSVTGHCWSSHRTIQWDYYLPCTACVQKWRGSFYLHLNILQHSEHYNLNLINLINIHLKYWREMYADKSYFSCWDMNAVAKSLSLREEMLRVCLFIFCLF